MGYKENGKKKSVHVNVQHLPGNLPLLYPTQKRLGRLVHHKKCDGLFSLKEMTLLFVCTYSFDGSSLFKGMCSNERIGDLLLGNTAFILFQR